MQYYWVQIDLNELIQIISPLNTISLLVNAQMEPMSISVKNRLFLADLFGTEEATSVLSCLICFSLYVLMYNQI